MATLPAEMKALICEDVGKPLQLKTVQTPEAIPGSCVVQVVAVAFDHSLLEILSGRLGFTFPKNLCPGGRCIGRVAARGIDTTSLETGQLVMIENFVRARDDPNNQILWGFFDGGKPITRKWMADNWAMACMAEYVRTPLENCHALNEAVLCGSPSEGGLGYTPYDLLHLSAQLVPLAGFRAIRLEPGERIIVAPGTGYFSGAAVQVAVAIGANVIAMGRNLRVLQQVQASFPPGRVQVVQTTGDVQKDAAALKQWGPVDAYLDISPAQAGASTHFRSCFMAVRQYGRVALMGAVNDDLSMPYSLAVWNNILIKGQYMYERDDVRQIIRLAESGRLKLGKEGGIEVAGKFKLEEVDKALGVLEKKVDAGAAFMFTP